MTLPPFAPPSPGAWELEQTHLTKPVSMFLSGIFPDAMMRGFADGTRAYGALLDHLEVAVINRFIYMAPRAVGAPKSAKAAPPKALFKLLSRVHPEMRRRIRRAEEVFRDRLWRDEADRWHREVKPSLVAEALALRQQDLTSLSSTDLARHVERAARFARTAIYTHHRYNMCAMVPIGDFVVQVMDWTGLPPATILQSLRGLSPVSAGAVDELAAVRDALEHEPAALARLQSGSPPRDVIAELEGWPAPVGPAVRQYLDVVGLRVVGGYDVGERHAREHPDMLVSILRTAIESRPANGAGTAAVARLRERVPSEHHSAFDVLLDEARIAYPIRDERVLHGDALATGLARRAILEAGRRLVADGRAAEPEHLVDATPEEIVALLAGRSEPSAEELAARYRWRVTTPLSSAPPRLGLPPSAPPPADWLPPAAARLQRAVDLVLSLMFAQRTPEGAQTTLKGFGVSPGMYEGPARVIRTVDELPAVQAGEVLIASSTGPTFNVVLPLIGAVVTERGGALSHAAIVAREYGLPGVVGCAGVTHAVATGAHVRVNGDSGEVDIIR